MANMQQALLFPSTVNISTENTALQTWYDASGSSYRGVNNFNTTVTNGTDITQWVDRSAAAKNANVSGGTSKPTFVTNQQNTLAALQFDSGDKLSVNPFTAYNNVTGYSAFIVCKFTGTAIRQRLTETDHTADGEAGFGISATGLYEYAAAGGICTGATANTSWNVHSFVYDGAAPSDTRIRARINGQLQNLTFTATPGTSTGTATTLQIGTRPDGTLPFVGYVGEFLVFTRALTTAEVNSVNTYLRGKWGL